MPLGGSRIKEFHAQLLEVHFLKGLQRFRDLKVPHKSSSRAFSIALNKELGFRALTMDLFSLVMKGYQGALGSKSRFGASLKE